LSRKGDLVIVTMPVLDKGLNPLIDGFNWSAHNLSNPPVRSYLIRRKFILYKSSKKN